LIPNRFRPLPARVVVLLACLVTTLLASARVVAQDWTGEETTAAVSKIQDGQLASDVLWLLEQAPVVDPTQADPDQSFGKKTQQRIDGLFGVVNAYLAPILFRDIALGVFDPALEDVKDDMSRSQADLQALLALPESQRDADRVTVTQKAVENLSAQAALLEAKDAARNVDLPRARKVLDAYLALPAGQRDDGLTGRLADVVAAIAGRATRTVYTVPLIIVFLLVGGVFFTFRYGFINVRLFAHSLRVIRGKYDNPDDHGEISHFQALTSALSATVGLGNIAGVAIAISQGGPGAVFWMWVVAFFGMSSKFSSCTLAQVYRRISTEAKDHGAADNAHGALPGKPEHVLGGPMVYLAEGMKEVFGKFLGRPIGKVLAILFAFFAIMGSLGGGNMFQGNQTFAIVSDVMFEQRIENEAELLDRVELGDAAAATELKRARIDAANRKEQMKGSYAWVGGLTMAVLVGFVIVGGIKRIGEVTSRLVPAMCVFYVGVCLLIVLKNYQQVPELLGGIFAGAFSAKAISWGGIMGVLVIGVKRGAFSNEAGLGSAAIAHSAAKTKEPVREGVVAMIGPFIDTIVVCTMTALAILITGAHTSGDTSGFSNEGVGITAAAFSSLAPWLTLMLMLAVFVFAYSTMISWSYYGERASEYLFGHWGIWPFRVVFLVFVFLGPMVSLNNVIEFTDLLILSMAYPNILGMIFLSRKVAKLAKDYTRRLNTGEMKPNQPRAQASG
jgi:alanine or glycine:cation symporter, AGCS family